MLGLECIGWRRGFALSASKEDGEGSDGEVPPADKPEVVNEIPPTLGLYRSLDHPRAARINLTDKSRGPRSRCRRSPLRLDEVRRRALHRRPLFPISHNEEEE